MCWVSGEMPLSLISRLPIRSSPSSTTPTSTRTLLPLSASLISRCKRLTSSAYEALSNPKNKSQYDSHARTNPFQEREGTYDPHADFSRSELRYHIENRYAYYDDDFAKTSSKSNTKKASEDEYDSFFKFRGTSEAGSTSSSLFKGADISVGCLSNAGKSTLEVEFIDSYRGLKKEMEVVRDTQCSKCGGTGAAPGTHPHTCTSCAG